MSVVLEASNWDGRQPLTVECHTGMADRLAQLVGVGTTGVGFAFAGLPIVEGWYSVALYPKMCEPAFGLLVMGLLLVWLGMWLLLSCRPSTWRFDSGGCTFLGPGDRRGELRWAEVEAVKLERHRVTFRTRTDRFVLGWANVPNPCRAKVWGWLNRGLRESFDYPPPPMSRKARLWLFFRLCLFVAFAWALFHRWRQVPLAWLDAHVDWIRNHETLRRMIVAHPTVAVWLTIFVIYVLPPILVCKVLFSTEMKRSWVTRRKGTGELSAPPVESRVRPADTVGV